MWLCRFCHDEVHADEDLAAMRGHIAHAPTADTPALLHRHRWALLDDTGDLDEIPEAYALAVIHLIERHRDNPHVARSVRA